MNADWSSSQGGVTDEPVGGEDLVPVVTDLPEGPAVAPAAGHTHRIGVGRAEERLGRRGAPVDEQPLARVVGEPEASDVDRLTTASGPDVAKAQVEAVAPQRAQPGTQAVHLEVAVEGGLPPARRCPPSDV